MARIKEKTNKNLASNIWTGIIVGVLGAVVITGIVLTILYFVNKNKNDDTEKTFDEVYEKADLKTFDWLSEVLNNEDTEIKFEEGYSEAIYVFVYSPDTEAQKDQDINYNGETIKLSDFIKQVVEAKPTNFFVINVLSDENKDKTSPISDLATDKPTLLMIGYGANEQGHIGVVIPSEFEDMELEDGSVTNKNDIVNILERVKNN